MLGYECPVCGDLIAISKPKEMRDCPCCKAPVVTQQIIRLRVR